jgi:hypothetical protein
MKKHIQYLAVILAFTLALIPAVSAHPIKPVYCDVTLTWTGAMWTGDISGDIEGTFQVLLDGAPIFPGGDPAAPPPPGMTEHFAENWVITTDNGVIEIYDEGVWTFNTFKFRANGRVTSATEDYAYLEGAKVKIMGTTSSLAADPITGTATMRFN